MQPRVLIVGAGPTGLTAAVELARRGILPRVIDRRPDASQLSRAVGILARSLTILGPSGVADAIRAEAITVKAVAFHRGARRIARFPLDFDDRSHVLGLPQDRTEALLAAAFRRYGGTVDYGQSFTTLAQDADGVDATISGRSERFDYVIGADGVHSGVRAALGLAFPGYDLPDDWSIADVESPDWRDPGMFQGFILPGRDVCVVLPLAPRRFRIIASRPDALAALPVPMNVTALHASGTFTIAVRQVTDYRVGRVCLAGDAAHCHSPVGGRGMNLGIADAADLAGRIAAGDLSGYHAARQPEGTHVLAFSERGRRLLQSPYPALRALLPPAMWTVSRIPPLARTLMRFLVNG